jgi:hypothetical protein
MHRVRGEYATNSAVSKIQKDAEAVTRKWDRTLEQMFGPGDGKGGVIGKQLVNHEERVTTLEKNQLDDVKVRNIVTAMFKDPTLANQLMAYLLDTERGKQLLTEVAAAQTAADEAKTANAATRALAERADSNAGTALSVHGAEHDRKNYQRNLKALEKTNPELAKTERGWLNEKVRDKTVQAQLEKLWASQGR